MVLSIKMVRHYHFPDVSPYGCDYTPVQWVAVGTTQQHSVAVMVFLIGQPGSWHPPTV